MTHPNFSADASIGSVSGKWTLMARGPDGAIVYEDFTSLTGDLVVAHAGGAHKTYSKSYAPGSAFAKNPYRGHGLDDVLNSDTDLLAGELLVGGADPDYGAVADCLPPIDKMLTYSFVGTRESFDKVAFAYGGRTPTFDPAIYVPAIHDIRARKEVGDGLVGGWLPILRFVYPEGDDWTEMLAFAPRRMFNENRWMQPVWYRLARVEAGVLKWVRYIDSYVVFPPRTEEGPDRFYADFTDLDARWAADLSGAMQIVVPDAQLNDMAKHSLVRAMITRFDLDPKYGVVDRNYGGSEHDGFPDTFNADVLALCDWGLIDLAGQYIDNYLTRFVREDGAILYRGPETGQYGRMLTVLAQYVEQGGDSALLLRHRARIDGITGVLLGLRDTGLRRAATDPAHGLLAAWSEADSCLDPDPPRYMQPYFGNSTEAARGFGDLGRVWQRLGLADHGARLTSEAAALEADIQRAVARSILPGEPPCLPSIAGVSEPPHIIVKRDKLDPQFRGYRSFMEMLFSGNLTRSQVETVVNYRAGHRDTILGLPTAYGYDTHEVAGFLTYGHSYGLLQHDLIPEFLLSLYSMMAHQYTRGTWTAPETRNLNPGVASAPYCVPAQLTVPMLLRWMLAFEDPRSETLWLCKGVPRDWFAPGQTISAKAVPTRWGQVGFSIVSHADRTEIDLVGSTARPHAVRIRLRLPNCRLVLSAHLGSMELAVESNAIYVPGGTSGHVTVRTT